MANLGLSLGEERRANDPGADDQRKETADDDDEEKAQAELCPQRKLRRFHAACFGPALSKNGADR
jgi:hypothetical protein